MIRIRFCFGYLIVATLTSAARAEAGESGQSVVPSVCAAPDGSAEHRVFAFDSMSMDASCDSLASAVGWLRRDFARSWDVLAGTPEPLRQSREGHWLEGQIWLARGNAKNAYEELRPERGGWPCNPHVLWDLAVAAAVVQKNSVAVEAYQRLLQTDMADERARLAMRLEFAALETRRHSNGIAAGRAIVMSIALSDTEPDTCLWVAAARILVEELDETFKPSHRWSCSRERRWSRYLGSSEGSAAIFAEVPSSNSWLRIPRNERISLVALGLGEAHNELRRRLWRAVDVTEQSSLFELRRRELARLARER